MDENKLLMNRSRFGKEETIALLSVGLVFGALFFYFPYTLGHSMHLKSVFAEALWMWNGFPDWQHGILVGPFALWMVYRKREELKKIPIQSSGLGLATICFGLLVYFFGYLADLQYAGYFSFHLLLAGAILWFLGIAWMRALSFPWAFSIFLWPMPFLDNLVSFPLRMIMSQGAHVLLSLVGVHNLRIGTAIVSMADPAHGVLEGARFAIDIADPCSGIRSLFTLLMIAALYGYFTLDTTWKKWVVFIAAVPLAVLGNMIRILILTFATMAVGPDFAIGTLDHPTWFHMGAGYAVFAVALFGMMGVGWLLQRTHLSLASVQEKPSIAKPPGRPSDSY